VFLGSWSKRRNRRKSSVVARLALSFAVALAWLVWEAPQAPATAQTNAPTVATPVAERPWHVVILNDSDPTVPAFVAIDRAMRASLMAPGRHPVDSFAEALDMLRFPGPQIENELVALFAKKYAAMHVDAVVTFGTPLRQRSSGQGAGSERTGNSRLSQTHQGRLGAGGQFGESALLRKRKAIAYYNPGGASIGLQAGAQQYGRGGGGGASGARAGGGGGAHADAGGGVAVTPVRTSRSTTAGLTCVPTMSRSTSVNNVNVNRDVNVSTWYQPQGSKFVVITPPY